MEISSQGLAPSRVVATLLLRRSPFRPRGCLSGSLPPFSSAKFQIRRSQILYLKFAYGCSFAPLFDPPRKELAFDADNSATHVDDGSSLLASSSWRCAGPRSRPSSASRCRRCSSCPSAAAQESLLTSCAKDRLSSSTLIAKKPLTKTRNASLRRATPTEQILHRSREF